MVECLVTHAARVCAASFGLIRRCRAEAALAGACLLLPLYGFGQVSISEGGSPTYSHAIAVPPGVSGMAPNIGLLYSGGGVNGPVGHGWSIQGISTITRCPAVKAIDVATRGVDYTGADKLCLDGQRLIQTDSTGTAIAFPQNNDALGGASLMREFRTEKDTFARIRAYGSIGGVAANGPAYFKVWTKSGQIYEYGNNTNASANAAIAIQGKTAVSAWAVSRISDTLGNYIDFQYEQRDVAWGSGPTPGAPLPGHEWNLVEIRYTGTPSQQPRNKVVFDYVDRPDTPGMVQDRAEAYHQGSKNVSVRRLAAVRTYTNWPADVSPWPSAAPSTAIKVKATKLTYDQGPATKRSRVRQIQDCVGTAETQCLPPTQFSYASGGNEAYQANGAFATSSLATLEMQSTLGAFGVVPIDFNGDGKTDFIRWSETTTYSQLYRSEGDGNFTQIPNGTSSGQFNITDQYLFKSDGCYTSLFVDLNGDGLPDILRYSGPKNIEDYICPGYGPVLLYLNAGTGSFTPATYTGPVLERLTSKPISDCFVTPVNGYCADPADHKGWTRGANFYLIDVNGDGKLDIVTSVLPFYGNTDPIVDPCASTVCTRVYTGNGNGSFTEIATNIANRSIYIPPKKSGGIGTPTNVVDVNGDGLADIVGLDTGYFDFAGTKVPYFNSNPVLQSRGDGNFDLKGAGTTCRTPVDFNGDGRWDCAFFDGSTAGYELHFSDGTGVLQQSSGFSVGEASPVLNGQTAGVVFVDVNGDGRHDMLRWREDPTQNKIYIGLGDGRFTPSTTFNLTTSDFQLKKSDFTAEFLTGDFTGRGNVEILRLKASPTPGAATSNQLYVKVDSTPPDQLVSVTSPTGLVTDLTWVPLSNPVSGALGDRYTSDRGTPNASTYPKVDVTAPMYVVATSTADSGVGGSRVATEYRYAGLKAAYDGRGMQGFREIRRQFKGPDGTDQTVVTQYLQDQPYAGVASKTETFIGPLNALPGTPISRSTYTYCDKSASGASEAAATPAAPCAVAATAKIQRPYLFRSVEEGWDLASNGSAALPKLTTTNSYNATVDPTQIEVRTEGTALGLSQLSIRTTTNTYFPDDTSGDNWILSRLQRATQQNSVQNHLSSIGTAPGGEPLASATTGTGPIQLATLTSTLNFGSVSVGFSANLTATLQSTGIAALSVTAPGPASVTGTDFSFVSTTCGSSLAAGGSCTVTVKFQPTAGVARSGGLSIVTGAGTKTASLVGSGTASSVAVSANGASALSAPKGGSPASGVVTFTNSGNEVASLSLSGLSSPYSVAPASCSAAAGGGTCSVTVTMSTGGPVGGQGTQTLTASGSTGGPVTASVSGTLLGSSTAVTTNNASALVATYGGASASGTVAFTNSGNQAATLTMSGLSAPYSVSPGSCTATAGSTCSVTVSMASGGAIGNQGAQTLTATGGTTGPVTATVSGRVDGSAISVTANGASALSANYGAAAATGTVTFTNSGNLAANLSFTGLSSPYSVSPATCTAAAGGGVCNVVVSMGTTGAPGAQGAQVLTASGGSTGNVTASVSGTVNGSVIATTSNGASSLSATKGAASATGTVTFTNSGNQAATLTMSGLSGAYSVAPTSCTAAAGGNCVVTVSMSTGGNIGPQGSQTLLSTGGSTGVAQAPVFGTLTGSVATLISSAPSMAAWYGAAAPTASATFRNDGNVNMTLTGLSGLSPRFSLVSNSCSNVVPGAACSMTLSMSTATVGGVFSQVSTVGATLDASFQVSGSTYAAISRWSVTSLGFATVTVGSSSSQFVTLYNDGAGPSMNWWAPLTNLPAGFTADTSLCSSVAPGGSCSVRITFAPTAAQAYSGSSISPSSITYANNTLSVSGVGGVPPTTIGVSPASLSFPTQQKGGGSNKTLTVTNSGSTAATGLNFTLTLGPDNGVGTFYRNGGTCPANGGSLAAGAQCTVIIRFDSYCSPGTRSATLVTSGANFSAVSTNISGSTTSSGFCPL